MWAWVRSNTLILSALLVLLLVIASMFVVSATGWKSLTVGNGGQWASAIFSACILGFSIWQVFSERRRHRQDTIERQRLEQLKTAQALSIWPFIRIGKAGNRIAWAIALQNRSHAPILQWSLNAKATPAASNGSTDNLVIDSARFGGLEPQAEGPTTFDFTDISAAQDATFNFYAQWTDYMGIHWESANGAVSRSDP